MRVIIVTLILLGGCTAVQEDDRICLDWDYTVEQVERCIPMYGNMICTTEEKTRHWCKLYEEAP